MPSVTLDHTLRIVQRVYPQVYLACHTRHQRKRSTAHRLSARDSTILAHLSETERIAPATLAAHLGVARSTLSEALKKLQQRGFVLTSPRMSTAGRRGGTDIRLTPRGRSAIADTSVLETERLHELLLSLTAAEHRAITRGMRALARGCERMASTSPASHANEGRV